MPQQQQQLLAHVQAKEQGSIISSLTANCADTDPRRSRVLRSGLGVRDGLPTGSDGSRQVDSPIQTALPVVGAASKDQPDLLMKQHAQHQKQVQIQKQQLLQQAGNAQVRFQPRVGLFLAAAAGSVINIIDVETDQPHLSLKGHNKEIRSMCWDSSGKFLATVSEDSVRVWSMASDGECIHQLNSCGNKFHSSVFHPSYSLLLIIRGYQLLELWNPMENKSMTVPAHGGPVAALPNSSGTGMVASASHDKCVKLYK